MALKLLSATQSSGEAFLFEITLPQQLSQTPSPFWGLGGLGEYRGSDDSVCLAVRWCLLSLPGVLWATVRSVRRLPMAGPTDTL